MQPSSRVFRLEDPDYPDALRELERPPERVVVRGRLPAPPGIAIVGTRIASERAIDFTRDLAEALAGHGVAVFSGGAFGIDAAAHEGAIRGAGLTVVVLGTGIDRCYPKEHRGLFDRVVDAGGALLSIFPDDQRGVPWNFVSRDRILAAMAGVTLVVEAPLESGARLTAAAARTLGRPVFVVPYPPWEKLGAGNLAEMALGARAYTGIESLLEALDPTLARWAKARGTIVATPRRREHVRAKPRAAARHTYDESDDTFEPPSPRLIDADPRLEQVRQRVVEVAQNGPVHLDSICDQTGLLPPLVCRALLTLTLEAVLVEDSAGWYRLPK